MPKVAIGEVYFPGTEKYTAVRRKFLNKRLSTQFPIKFRAYSSCAEPLFAELDSPI